VRVDTSSGKWIYVNSFLSGNPKCPPNEAEPEQCGLVLVTHGHGDQVGDTVAIHQRHGCPVVAQLKLRGRPAANGVADDGQAHSINKGDTCSVAGVEVTLTTANHSSSTPDGGDGGEAAGMVSSSRPLTARLRRARSPGSECVFPTGS
jgi:L-ascorbate metabolism protein UlaG (beta-lactamase superfamily)